MAARVNELYNGIINAKAAAQAEKSALNALLDGQSTAKATYGALLKKQAAGTLTETEKPQVEQAEAAHSSFEPRISAQRKLVTQAEAGVLEAEQEHAAEVARIAAEDAKLPTQAAARVEPIKDGNDESRFASLGHRLMAVARAADVTKGPADRRLFAGPTGLGETVASDGGYAVGTDQGASIMERVYDTGELIKRVNRIPISTSANGLKLPAIDETSRADGSRSGGIQGYWVEEAGSITASQPKLRINSLTLHKVAALVYVTDELLADASALEAWIMKNLPAELVFKIEDAIVNGDGSGKPLGWRNGDAVVSVAKNGGQAAATFDYDNVINMWSRMWGRSRGNSIWLINQDVEPQLYKMSLAVGTGGAPVFMPAGGASAAPFATLFGRPIIPAEYCSTLGTVGDVQLVDPTQYTIIDKGGVQVASSMHVQFLTDQMAFRFIMRVDGLPDWNAPLTPKSGSTKTLSPYITLATRA